MIPDWLAAGYRVCFVRISTSFAMIPTPLAEAL
jgi:hypothetical protein